MTPKAFTIGGEGHLSSIITPIAVRQSKDLCCQFKLHFQHANVRALWDTGAANSSMSHGLARYLGLKPVDICYVNGLSGLQASNVYLLDILLPSAVEIFNIRVSEFVDNGYFEIVIGMDIIGLGDLAISNKDNNTLVSFRMPPSEKPIDYLELILKENNIK